MAAKTKNGSMPLKNAALQLVVVSFGHSEVHYSSSVGVTEPDKREKSEKCQIPTWEPA